MARARKAHGIAALQAGAQSQADREGVWQAVNLFGDEAGDLHVLLTSVEDIVGVRDGKRLGSRCGESDRPRPDLRPILPKPPRVLGATRAARRNRSMCSARCSQEFVKVNY
jgi:hypothetical protein